MKTSLLWALLFFSAAQADEPPPIDVRPDIAELRRSVAELKQEIAKERAARVRLGYDDGLQLVIAPLSLRLRADAIVRYRAQVTDRTLYNVSTFELLHAQTELDAGLYGWLRLYTLFDFGGRYLGSGNVRFLRDLFVEVRPLSWLSIRGGQLLVPFGRQALIRAPDLGLMDSSLATSAFAFDRDIGLQLDLSFWRERFLVQIAATDGIAAGRLTRNNNLDLRYTLRLLASPLGPLPLGESALQQPSRFRFAVGGAVQYDLHPVDIPLPNNEFDPNGRPDNVEVVSGNLEATMMWRGVMVTGEYFVRQERPGGGLPSRLFHGGHFQLQALVWKRIDLVLRIAYADFHSLGISDPLGVLFGQPQNGIEAAGGLNVYLWRNRVVAKVGYHFRRDQTSDALDMRRHMGHQFGVGLQAGF